MSQETANNKLSTIVENSIPFFIREENPAFEVFLKKYYEFMEQPSANLASGQPIERLMNFRKNLDIDETTDPAFDDLLYASFMKNFPQTVIADKTIILKNIKDFYRSKGSEKSIRFLINMLSGDANTEVYYPKTDILKYSSSKWFKQKTVRVSDVLIDGQANNDLTGLQKFVSRQILGNTTNSSATVESVNRTYERGALINELYLSGIYNNFSATEEIMARYTEEGEEHVVSARVFGGQVRAIYINDPGSGYHVGDYLNFVFDPTNQGSGANAVITEVSTGNVTAVRVAYSGAGFRVDDPLLFIGTGVGAAAEVETVNSNEFYHPNTYNIYTSIIGHEANTLIGNAVYSNLNAGNANVALENVFNYFSFAGLGQPSSIVVTAPGSGYTEPPKANISGNTWIRAAGILGRMNVLSRGTGYVIGDEINIINVPGGYGEGGHANVRNVLANGAITEVGFDRVPGFYYGGFGYSQTHLPRTEIISANGVGANVILTDLMGYGDRLVAVNSLVGQIATISINDPGVSYNVAPSIDMTELGNGDANLEAVIIQGVYTYPGRSLDDDGFLSSSNYIRGENYYQNYSYVIRSNQPMSVYKDTVLKLAHPAGLKLFGTYLLNAEPEMASNVASITTDIAYGSNNVIELTEDLSPNAYALAVWYDPSDLTTMYQDTAGTIPATVDGPVARIDDKSGYGRNATQSTANSQPYLRMDEFDKYYLDFDGTDDSLVTSAFDTGSDAVFVAAGVLIEEPETISSFICTYGPYGANATFALVAPYSNNQYEYAWYSRGTAASLALISNVAYDRPHKTVISGKAQISSNTNNVRIGGVGVGADADNQGTGNYANNILYIGRRHTAANYLNGRLYSYVQMNTLPTLSQVIQLEQWSADKTGLVIPF